MADLKLKKQLLYNLGYSLLDTGSNFVRKSMDIEKKKLTSQEFEKIIVNQTILKADDIYLPDSMYHLTDWETWRKIIKADLIDEKEYIDEVFDCDNYADFFAGRATYLYLLNSCGPCSGKIFHYKTNKFLGYHRFNLIVALGKDTPIVYLYEPMSDNWVKIKESDTIALWRYHPSHCSFN